MNQVIINGEKFEINDPGICKDYFTGEFIIKDASFMIASSITLGPDGYESSVEAVYTDRVNLENALMSGKILTLKVRYGSIYITPQCTRTGNGKIYKSTDPTEAFTFYDNWTHPRFNISNKFRSFNNQIRAFTDLDNPHIQEIDKKMLLNRNYEFGVDSATYKIFEGLTYTFGVELETSSGRLNDNDILGLNLKCEFDGSLRETPDQRKEDVLGGEYITGVLKGDSGMFQLQKICNKLTEKCTINSKCGVHVHIGGINLTKENIVYMYILGEILQNEVYEMLPASRRQNSYCKKLKSLDLSLDKLSSINTSLGYEILIDEYYNKIFKEVSHGKNNPDKNSNKRYNHPMGSKCGYNKDTQRYCWLNFVTAIFNTKDNPDAMTLEFRSHSATLNYSKIKNWVKICFAFVAFVENCKSSIKRGYWLDKNKCEYNLNLSTIVKAIYPKTNKTLINYIDQRKALFLKDDGKIEEVEYKDDKKGVKSLTMKEDILCV